MDEDIFTLHFQRELWLVRRIEQEHPEWVEADGACRRCLEALRSGEARPPRGPRGEGNPPH